MSLGDTPRRVARRGASLAAYRSSRLCQDIRRNTLRCPREPAPFDTPLNELIAPTLYRIVFLFFFISGFSSLVFEILWERMLRQVFGTTSFALSTLLTAFMGGMALGSWLCSKYADELDRPLRVYGLLEGGIGLYALVVPLALDYLPTIYDAIFDFYLNDFYLFSLLRFVAAFAILILPTTLMGATLPIVSQWVSRRKRLFQGSIGILYGVNTFGACTGTLLAGFALLPTLGLSTTNSIFAGVNLALCLLVVSIDALFYQTLEPDKEFEALETPDETENASDLESDDTDEEDDPLDYDPAVTEKSESIPAWLAAAVLGTFAVSGAISMSYQVLWTRAYVIILGSSTYSFTLILGGFLIGIAAGSSLMSPFVKRIRRPVFWLGLTQIGVALFATVAFFVLDNLPRWMFFRFRGQIDSIAEVYIYYFFLVGIVVLIPTILQGMSFPLVIRSIVQDRDESGRQVGRAYAFNTAGSIVGSFAAGFILLASLGLYLSMKVVIALNIALAVGIGACELWDRFSRTRLAALAGAGLVALGVFWFAPRIDRTDLTRGMFRVSWARELFNVEQFRADEPELLFYEDGLTATVSVERRGETHTLKANGKPEASDTGDMNTQILVGLLPYVVRAQFDGVSLGGDESAMIGYGSGVTAGAALQWPLDSLEVVEIESAMIPASKYFNHVNHRPLQDDRMTIIESDGRNYLEYTDHEYDVIVSEPSNPWISGVASLFTLECFRSIKRHLREDGVFAQWVQLYEMRPENVKTILNTIRKVFPHVQGFTTKARGTDLILLASKRPIPFPAEGWKRGWNVDSARAELERAGIEQIYELYGLSFITEEELDDFARGAPLNTDDNGRLEYQAPKDLIRYRKGAEFFSDQYFEQTIYGDIRPSLEGWPDGSEWTPERVGQLARATWLAGKAEFAGILLEQAGYGEMEDLKGPVFPPYSPLQAIHVVRQVRSMELDRVLARDWPNYKSNYHEMLVETIRDDKHVQTSQYLETEEKPGRDGYAGERGLLYLYLLYHEGYDRAAELQLARLLSDGDDEIVETLPFQLLRGAVRWAQHDFEDSWDAYLKAGRMLSE